MEKWASNQNSGEPTVKFLERWLPSKRRWTAPYNYEFTGEVAERFKAHALKTVKQPNLPHFLDGDVWMMMEEDGRKLAVKS